MGCSLSKSLDLKPQPVGTVQHNPQRESREFADDLGFPRPYQDPISTDDQHTFPLDGREDIASVSDEELFRIYSTAPRLHKYGAVIIARVSKSMVIKGGSGVAESESQNMIFACESLHLPVPKVHRTFTATIPDASRTKAVTGHFIVMDYIAGPTVEACWPSLDAGSRESVARQVADTIEKMQSRDLNDTLPVGPIGRGRDQKFEGPWFTDYGAGPFPSLEDLEAWFNHKIDVCARLHQLPAGTPRFRFRDVVFTHQDIAPRNMILDEDEKVWLIDWGCAGVYPQGFDQAVLRLQSANDEFSDMVLARLSNQQKELTEQYRAIGYGLSTGRLL
ncbi:hypothetical protein AAE478_003814 [Parahypoxylon ruwenzoriense]